jgi:hypothetical protein
MSLRTFISCTVVSAVSVVADDATSCLQVDSPVFFLRLAEGLLVKKNHLVANGTPKGI